MIEKLDPIKHTDNLYDRNGFITNVACGGVVISKINELVDAVNVLQAQVAILQEHAHPTATTEPAKSTLTKSLRMDKEFAEDECVRLRNELDRTRKALDKGMEHITGLNNMIESWLNLINSDLDQETKLRILKSAISAYVENKGGNNE